MEGTSASLSSSTTTTSKSCGVCGYPNIDVRLHHPRTITLPNAAITTSNNNNTNVVNDACCFLHARCVPHSLITRKVSGSLVPVKPNESSCPCCTRPVMGLYLYPMSLHDLDQAVELRKQAATATAIGTDSSCSSTNNSGGGGNGKRGRSAVAPTSSEDELNFLSMQAEATYLLLSHSSTGGSSSLAEMSDYQRTGRWTEEETALVDCLIQVFDQGQYFALPEGMRLNDFLRDMLLCKSSRLTKKMKHAKLSSRCYEIQPSTSSIMNPRVFSALEQEFLNSIASLPSRLELRFNFCKVWRTALSNLCVQVGSPLLMADDWIGSLEVMEKKASEAEETVRKARRHRMGMALKTDSRTAETGVYFSGMPVHRPSPCKRQRSQQNVVSSTSASSSSSTTACGGVTLQEPCAPTSSSTATSSGGGMYPPPRVSSSDGPVYTDDASALPSQSSAASAVCSEEDGEADFIASMLDLGHPTNAGLGGGSTNNTRLRSESFDEFAKVFRYLSEDGGGAGAESEYDDSVLGGGGDGGGCRYHYDDASHLRSNCGPFLEAVMMQIELHNLPFEHVDVWVPSSDPTGSLFPQSTLSTSPSPSVENNSKSLRLYHAGYATRQGLDPMLVSRLNEFGEYSTKFSFAMGAGLPGRVFESGGFEWERMVDQANPKYFGRAGGARVYGVKTGLGISVTTNVIGRIVVALYSVRDLEHDDQVIRRCMQEFTKLSPEPKWTLVVEMAPNSSACGALPPPMSGTTGLTTTTSANRARLTSISSLGSGVDHYHYQDVSAGDYSNDQKPSSSGAGAAIAANALSSSFQEFGVPSSVTIGVPSGITNTNNTGTSATIPLISSNTAELGMECRIAMLLGDHMPLNDVPPAAAFNNSSTTLIPSVADFMSLRLMLLRSPARRSNEENEMIEIIKNSYDGYCRDTHIRRTEKQIAFLLVTDWIYLRGPSPAPAPAPGSLQTQRLNDCSSNIQLPSNLKPPAKDCANNNNNNIGNANAAYPRRTSGASSAASGCGAGAHQPLLMYSTNSADRTKVRRGSSFDFVMNLINPETSSSLLLQPLQPSGSSAGMVHINHSPNVDITIVDDCSENS